MNQWRYTGAAKVGASTVIRKSLARAIPGRDEPQKVWGTSKCRVEGCDGLHLGNKSGIKNGCGNGYCSKHAKNYYRHGHPLGLRQRRWEELTESVLTWASEQSEQACRRLVLAAYAWRRSQYSRFPAGPHWANADRIAALLQASWDYADAEEMTDFLAARESLKNAASAIWRA